MKGEASLNEIAIDLITNYIEENLFDPEKSWPRDEFRQRSYARWAAGSILEEVMDATDIPAEITIEAFMLRMDCFAHSTRNEAGRILFSIARDTAEDILRLFV